MALEGVKRITEPASDEQAQFAQAMVDVVALGRERFGFGMAEAVSLMLCVAADLARGTYGPESLEDFAKLFLDRQAFELPPTAEQFEAMAEAAAAAKH